MNPQNPSSSATDEETLDFLLDLWEDAIERGERPLAEQICADHPQLLDQFYQKTKMLTQLNHQLEASMLNTPPRPATRGDKNGSPEAVPCTEIDWESHIDQLDYHAHGGLGIVFRGFDHKLHREVAVKFIRERRRQNRLDIQRFRVEAEITSRLDHPGVVPVHGFGISATGVPFYVMRMVEGNTLQERIDDYHKRLRKEATVSDNTVEFRKLLSSFISVCNTIEYAHNRGVINCDIKPGNIMLGKYGETIVLDWGCAKYVGSSGKAKSVGEESLKPLSDAGRSDPSRLTGGTPIYMSPEQHAESEEIGPASDIYSLGVTLHRLITGTPAFSPELSLPKIRESVLRGKFRKPTDVCPWLSRALEAICLKAMSLTPEDRYQHASDLARDLERYLADEVVDAYVEPFSRRLARLMRRHRGVSQVLMLSVGLLILVSSIFAVVMGQSAARETEARKMATVMRNRSLQLAARSAATSMALKINDAWRILEIESNSPFLQQELQRVQTLKDPTEWEALQDWLLQRAAHNDRATEASSWFLCDTHGRQLARYPLIDQETKSFYDSIGEVYAHRDYFHGNGLDLPNGKTGSPPHIDQVHLSAVYQSSNTANLKVAFSIPIWQPAAGDAPRKFLGVLGYSVELSQFAVLEDQHDSQNLQQMAVLVDLRKVTNSTADDLYGVILQHPELSRKLAALAPDLKLLNRLSQPMLEKIEAYRLQRVEQIRATGFASSTSDVLLINDFQDPFETDAAGSIIAALEPVCVVGRSAEAFDTGWMVVVEEYATESAPAITTDRRPE